MSNKLEPRDVIPEGDFCIINHVYEEFDTITILGGNAEVCQYLSRDREGRLHCNYLENELHINNGVVPKLCGVNQGYFDYDAEDNQS